MNTIRRFSSRRQRLDHAFLSVRLKEAKPYKRIAGYFRSSIFELVGEEMMDEYIHLRQKAHDVFEMRYQESIDPDKDRWELCSKVLARRDVVDRLSAPW